MSYAVEVSYADKTFVVEVVPKKVKNVNVRLSADGTARMSVPQWMTRVQVTEIARSHAEWLYRHVARLKQRREESPLEWVSGEVVNVWGEPTELALVVCDNACEVRQKDGRLLIFAPPSFVPQDRAALVEAWLKSELTHALVDLRPLCEGRVGRTATSITLRRMKTRWGSCTTKTGRIRLNTALAECPPKCLETVLVHELCHLREANHSSRFYALMDLHCPDWRVWQRWLDEHPPRLL